MARFRIRYLNYDLELAPGTFTIGRSPDCQLALDDPLISRKHASLHVVDTQVVFEDHGSRNGSTVNGVAVRGARTLAAGDKIGIGSQEILFGVAEPEPAPPEAKPAPARSHCTSCGAALRPKAVSCHACGVRVAGAWEKVRCASCGALASYDDAECPSCNARMGRRAANRTIIRPTEPEMEQKSAFRLLAGVADKALSLGRVDDAERLLGNLLRDLHTQVRVGQLVDPESIEDATRYALRLVEVGARTTWIDWIFEVHRLADHLVSGTTIDSLHVLVRRVRYPAGQALTDYVEQLRARSTSMTVVERFLFKRLEGLRAVCASQ